MSFINFRSSKVVFFAVFLVFLFLINSSYSLTFAQQEKTAADLKREAVELYHSGAYVQAIEKLKQIEGKTTDKYILAQAYIYLSMSYFCLEEKEEATKWLDKAVAANPEISEADLLFPPGFENLYAKAKEGAAKPALAKTPASVAKPPVVKPSAGTGVKKKGKSKLFLIAGGVVAAGVIAVVLLGGGAKTGSIQVNSTPAGAKVYLDATDTGKTTNCTLLNVSPGSHTVRLVKDGYVDFSGSTTVTKGQTANVTVTLTANTIVISKPAAGQLILKGTAVTIEWNVPGTSSVRSSGDVSGQLNAALEGRQGLAIQRMRGIGSRSNQDRRADSWREKEWEGSRNSRELRENQSGAELSEAQSASSSGAVSADASETTMPGIIPNGALNSQLKPQANGSSGRANILAIEKVKIELYKGATLSTLVVAETNNTGTYTWTVPTTLTLLDGTDYKFRISCTTAPAVYNETANFTIRHWHEFVLAFGSSGTGDGQFGSNYVVALDSTGNVYAADYTNHRVQKFTSSGTFLGWWGLDDLGATGWHAPGSGRTGVSGTALGQFSGPFGIAVDSAGNVYVSNYNNSRVEKLTVSSGVWSWFGGTAGTGNGQFSTPSQIAFDSTGNVYVSDRGNDRVQKFNSSGGYLAQWGSSGTGDGQFISPDGIAVDSSNNVYVGDQETYRIQKFTSSGTLLGWWGLDNIGSTGWHAPGSGRWGVSGSLDGQFNRPGNLAVHSSGNIYVGDSANDRLQEFTSGGIFSAKYGTAGAGNGQFDNPWGIAINNSTGYIYVADSMNARIQIIRRVG